MLHPHSRWRDLPRVWWVERVADTMENRVHERRGGHRYEGRRREWLGSFKHCFATSADMEFE